METSRKSSNFLDKKFLNFHLSSLLESAIPFTMVLYTILAAIQDKFYGLTSLNFISGYFVTVIVALLFGILFYKLYGTHDFRFKIFIHVVLFAFAVIAILLLVPVIGTTRLLDPNRTKSVVQILIDFSIVSTLPLIGILGSFLNIFNLMTPLEREVEFLSDKLRAGEFNHRIENQQVLADSGMGKTAVLINQMLTQIDAMVSVLQNNIEKNLVSSQEIASSSEEINAAVEEVSSTSQSMSHAASQQAEMIATSVEEIVSVNQIIETIINQIQNNSNVISQIALQTNILALNAGIEASRAGDYGRGFAVVAENVRRLSEESKNAAEEINHVADSIAEQLRSSFSGIRIQIEEVAALSEETAASAEEVSAAAEEVNSSIESISMTIQHLVDQTQTTNNVFTKYIK